eukprot:3553163-Alexandrium_andersonii.AAC.1
MSASLVGSEMCIRDRGEGEFCELPRYQSRLRGGAATPGFLQALDQLLFQGRWRREEKGHTWAELVVLFVIRTGGTAELVRGRRLPGFCS